MTKTLILFLLLVLTAGTKNIEAQCDLYKRALINSEVIFESDHRDRRSNPERRINNMAISDGGSFFAALEKNSINIYETQTGSLISSYEMPEKVQNSTVLSTKDVMISSNRYIFAIYNGGYGVAIDLLTGRRQEFETPHSGNNDWMFGWYAYVLPGDSILLGNRSVSGSWLISLSQGTITRTQWNYYAVDLKKGLFLNRKIKNNEPDWNAPLELRRYPSGEIVASFPGAYNASRISPDGNRILVIHPGGFSVYDIHSGTFIMKETGYRYIDSRSEWIGTSLIAFNAFDTIAHTSMEIFDVNAKKRLGRIASSQLDGRSYVANENYFVNFGAVKRGYPEMMKRCLKVFDLNIIRKKEDFFLDMMHFEKQTLEEKHLTDEHRMKAYSEGAPITDIDGNSYRTVIINGKTYMAENLSTSRFNNGDPVPFVAGSQEWEKLGSPAMAYYNNDPANLEIYGALYNGFTTAGKRNICPAGWHVISAEEWDELIDHLGGKDIAINRLVTTGNRREGNGLWSGFNYGATNNSGFSVMPAGRRTREGNYTLRYSSAKFWADSFRTASISKQMISTGGITDFRFGFSVRCMKD